MIDNYFESSFGNIKKLIELIKMDTRYDMENIRQFHRFN